MIVAFFVRLSKNFPCPVSILFGSENLGKKALKPFALRVVEKLCRRPDLDYSAFIHEHHLIRDLTGEIHFVRDHHHGHAALAKISHEAKHALDEFWIERARDLIEQHNLRIERKRASDCNTLLLPARKIGRTVVLAFAQSHIAQPVLCNPLGFAARAGLSPCAARA